MVQAATRQQININHCIDGNEPLLSAPSPRDDNAGGGGGGCKASRVGARDGDNDEPVPIVLA
jgi:hypothetical protein